MTNFEKIKNMSVEEMAEFFENLNVCVDDSIQGFSPDCSICSYNHNSSKSCPFSYPTEWLESEVEE